MNRWPRKVADSTSIKWQHIAEMPSNQRIFFYVPILGGKITWNTYEIDNYWCFRRDILFRDDPSIFSRIQSNDTQVFQE